jgi:hypothetical protein
VWGMPPPLLQVYARWGLGQWAHSVGLEPVVMSPLLVNACKCVPTLQACMLYLMDLSCVWQPSCSTLLPHTHCTGAASAGTNTMPTPAGLLFLVA